MMICVECRRYRDLPEGKGATEVYHMDMSEPPPLPPVDKQQPTIRAER
jgi:hypothetical protein